MKSRYQVDTVAVATLAVLFGILLARSWLAWGHLTEDYGREMYVPLRLAFGDVLYRDIRYPYGPFSPYLHALGYRVWRPHLDVLYASGIFFSTVCWLSCYAIARQLGSVGAALCGTALVIGELMFVPGHPAHFNFIFPYAYPALHGLAFALCALAGALALQERRRPGIAILTGIAIGLALLTKQEFGAVALMIGALATVGMALNPGLPAAGRQGALLASAAAVTAGLGYGVLALAVSPHTIVYRGLFDPVYFGWPLAWYIAGFRPGSTPIHVARVLIARSTSAAVPLALVASAALAIGHLAAVARRGSRAALLGLASSTAAAALLLAVATSWGWPAVLGMRYVALPLALLLWTVADTAALVARTLRGTVSVDAVRRWILVVTAAVLLSRVAGRAVPDSYANFYLAPGLLLASVVLIDGLPQLAARIAAYRMGVRAAGIATVVALLAVVLRNHDARYQARQATVATPRGTLRLPADDLWLPMYRDALAYLATQPPGASLLAIPGETALNFLSGHDNHLYETALVVVVSTEDDERAYIEALERDPPQIVLTSTRPQYEYGRGMFGTDYNRLIFHWIQTHYEAGLQLGTGSLRIQVWLPKRTSMNVASAATSQRSRTSAAAVAGCARRNRNGPASACCRFARDAANRSVAIHGASVGRWRSASVRGLAPARASATTASSAAASCRA